tara:strand:+ start:61 stop:510 length:450 start_codon:yes stop_codon:yes gene_type:complete
MPKLPEPWQGWFDTATANRNRISEGRIADGRFVIDAEPDLGQPPDETFLAEGLRLLAGRGECPPELLSALADLFDPPAGRRGATARLIQPKGGKAAKNSWYDIGQLADELADRDGYASAIAAVCAEFEIGESAAKDALRQYRASLSLRD